MAGDIQQRRPRSNGGPATEVDLTQPTDILAPHPDDGVGDLTSGETPAVPDPEPVPDPAVLHDVEVNFSLAGQIEGARCILVRGPYTYTVAEAEQLIADLQLAIAPVKQLRQIRKLDD